MRVPDNHVFYRNFGKKNELNFILKSNVPLLVNKNFSTKIISYEGQKLVSKYNNNIKNQL